jgi:polysaccharide biosynthesis transport protein
MALDRASSRIGRTQTGWTATIAVDAAHRTAWTLGLMSEHDLELAETSGLVHALHVLRERWWLIATCVSVSLVVAVIYVDHKPNEYTATASLQFTTNSLPSQVAGVGSGQSLDAEGEKNTDVQLVTSTPVALAVIEALKLRATPSELLGLVTTSDPQNDYVVNITVVDEDPKLAARIANAFAQQYVLYSQRQNEEQLIKGQQLIAKRIAQLPSSDTTERSDLNALSQKLLLLQAVASANARVASTAAVPGSPSSPKKKATAVVALFFGLLLGVGLAFLLNLMNTRVKSWEELEKLYGLRLVAGIPQRSRLGANRDAELEPFRILQNSLSLLAPDDGAVKTVLVTSAVPGEGKTTVAVGLASAAAQAGLDVVLVEADLRRPSISQRLRVDGGAAGLAEALFGDQNPVELLQSPYPEMPGLQVLTSGHVPQDAPGRLRPYELTRTFDALCSDAALVVIDSAPLLPVVDTRILLDELGVDACLIVARLGVTERNDVKGTRALLDHRGLRRSVGLVVNAMPPSGGYYYYGDDSSAHAIGRDRSAVRSSPVHPRSPR